MQYSASGKVKTKVIPQTNIENINEAIREFVAPDSTMVTDEHHAYNKLMKLISTGRLTTGLKNMYAGKKILVHTNNIEGFWNILKKQINGIHHSVSPKHLQTILR